MTASPAGTRTHRRPFVARGAFAAIGLLAVLVGGCGGGTPAATAATGGSGRSPSAAPVATASAGDTEAPDATDAGGNAGPSGAAGAMCKKVTLDEMKAIVGSAVTVSEGSDTECTWTTATFEAVNLRIEQGSSTDLTGQKLLFTDGRDIAAVGERAFWAPSVAVLYAVHRGKVYAAQLVLFTTDEAKNLQITTSVLQKALSRI